MDSPRRPYESPIREARAAETREKILDGVRRIFETDPESSLNFDEVAKVSGVNRRTIFRHFPSKDDLYIAFWEWTKNRLDVPSWPKNVRELTELPPVLFSEMEKIEGTVRSAHSSAIGRQMRIRVNDERLDAIRGSLAELTRDMDEKTVKRLEVMVQIMFSATTWLNMRDYWKLPGRECGEIASWGIQALIDAARRDNGENV